MEYLGDKMRHGGGDGSTYVAEMFALCGGVNIMDNIYRMVCCRGRQRFQVEEDVRPPSCGCNGRQARSCMRARASARAGARAH